jgi:hypothetical protein
MPWPVLKIADALPSTTADTGRLPAPHQVDVPRQEPRPASVQRESRPDRAAGRHGRHQPGPVTNLPGRCPTAGARPPGRLRLGAGRSALQRGRRRAVPDHDGQAELGPRAQRVRPGTHIVWLDQVHVQYRKDVFNLEAAIGMLKSTNHRFRMVTIFRRR